MTSFKIAVTGHRSERCKNEDAVRRLLREGLERIPPWEKPIYICGMADGCDLWGADEALDLGYEIWAIRPWRNHQERTPAPELYAKVTEAASRTVNVVEQDDFPGNWCYQKRNEWMVDNASHILAYWDGTERGGTWNCIRYARGKKPIRNVYV